MPTVGHVSVLHGIPKDFTKPERFACELLEEVCCRDAALVPCAVSNDQDRRGARRNQPGKTIEDLRHRRDVVAKGVCTLAGHAADACLPPLREMGLEQHVRDVGVGLRDLRPSDVGVKQRQPVFDGLRLAEPEHLQLMAAVVVDRPVVGRRRDHGIHPILEGPVQASGVAKKSLGRCVRTGLLGEGLARLYCEIHGTLEQGEWIHEATGRVPSLHVRGHF